MSEETVKTIAQKKLGEYGATDTQKTVTTKPAYQSWGRKSKPMSPNIKKRTTTYAEYAERVPAIKTPSVLSKAKVDEVLMQCRELPTPDQPIKNYAGYSRKEWDTLLDVAARYVADVLEGAGLQYKGFLAPDAFKKALSLALQENFFHHDPYDGRTRFISVDGRIDSDKRKP